MSDEIQRVQYLDRHLLRASDLQAEQAYHREVRWWHNRTFHLHGIVTGLDLNPEQINGQQYIVVQPGYALDDWGRELILPHALTLDATLFTPSDPAPKPGSSKEYYVVITYDRHPVTPSQTGSPCESSGLGREIEGSRILLLQREPAKGLLADARPSDNPRRIVPVLLGRVSVSRPTANRFEFTPCDLKSTPKLAYSAIRCQQIVPPARLPWPSGQKREFLTKASLLNPLPSISIEADLFTYRHLNVGCDFEIKSDLLEPPISDPKEEFGTKMPGSLKVAGDVFIQRHLFIQTSVCPLDPKDLSKDVRWVDVSARLASYCTRIRELEHQNADLKKDLDNVTAKFNRAIPAVVSVFGDNVVRDVGLEFPGEPLLELTENIAVQDMTKIDKVIAQVTVTPKEFNPVPEEAKLVRTFPGIWNLSTETLPKEDGGRTLRVRCNLGRSWKVGDKYRCEIKSVVVTAMVVCYPKVEVEA